jgi:hypothetical protein
MYYNGDMNASDYNERLKNIGRNDPCPCGSGKKYKKCHLSEDEAAKHAELAAAAEEREAALAAAEEDSDDDSADSASKSRKQKRGIHQGGGKARSGMDTHANIPRRGAV